MGSPVRLRQGYTGAEEGIGQPFLRPSLEEKFCRLRIPAWDSIALFRPRRIERRVAISIQNVEIGDGENQAMHAY